MAHDMRGKQAPSAGRGTLGTFAGVFTPSVLTILGIILFLRLGYVVGSAGLGRALVIIALANAISVLTTFSLSAIATNLKVKGGGDYYLISRTLGLEFGGAIGIVLFLAQSVSVAFYCIGFGEALAGMLQPGLGLSPRLIAAAAVALLFVLAWLGADWATRFQYVVMGILLLSLISFFAGGLSRWDGALLAGNWGAPPEGKAFWVLFAIFFPAVTGFTQGVSMSGDLKDAGKSLPLGTFLAVGVSIVVYIGAAVVFAAALPSEALIGDYGAMNRAALFGLLIDAGVIAATLSSAMASFLGAPRILQSLAGDRILPFLLPFAKGYGPTSNPRRGVLLSLCIAFGTIVLGNLNLIAPVVSMFFLISYGLLNYATYYEARTSSPSFRPRFRWFDRRLSLLGGLCCLGVILMIDLKAGAAGIAVLFALYQYLRRTAGPARWADSRRSYHFQRLREHLIDAAAESEHPRSWRPQLLAFSKDSQRRRQLLLFSSWLEGGSGLTTAVRILEGDGIMMPKMRSEAEEELKADIRAKELKAFSLVVVAPDLHSGMNTLLQAYGIGPLRANTLLFNWVERTQKGILGLREMMYSRSLKTAFRLGFHIVLLHTHEAPWAALEGTPSKEKRIDVWWWDDASSHLMLLFAYLMSRNEAWEGATIRVLATGPDENRERLEKVLQDVRIEAVPEIIHHAGADTILEKSADASLVFLPFRIREKRVMGPFEGDMEALLDRLPTAALVLAAEDIDLNADPEEGRPGEVAAALDLLTDREKVAREAEKVAEKAAEEADQKAGELESAVSSGAEDDLMEKVKATAEAGERAEKAARKLARAEAKAEDAAREVEALGVAPEKEAEDE